MTKSNEDLKIRDPQQWYAIIQEVARCMPMQVCGFNSDNEHYVMMDFEGASWVCEVVWNDGSIIWC